MSKYLVWKSIVATNLWRCAVLDRPGETDFAYDLLDLLIKICSKGATSIDLDLGEGYVIEFPTVNFIEPSTKTKT